MPVYGFKLIDAAATGSGHMRMDESVPGSLPVGAATGTGWTVGTNADGRYSALEYGSERAAGTFSTTLLPAGSPGTADCFRSERKLTGRFPAGNWAFAVKVVAVTAANGQRGAIRFRMLAGSDPTGAGANELHGVEETSEAGPFLATGTPATCSKTFDPGDVTLADEYLFFQIAWVTRNHGVPPANANDDILLYVDGSGLIAESTDFVPVEDDQNVPYGQQIGV